MADFMRKFLLLVLVCILALWLAVIYNFKSALSQRLQLPETSKILLVGKGDSLSKVIYDLENAGVLHHARWLIWHARLNDATLIRTGEYELTTDISGKELLQRLTSGRVIQYEVTLVEGKKLSDVMKLLSSQKKLINDIKDVTPEQYEKLFGFTPDKAEGWFFPDTYSFVSGSKMSDILLQAHHRLRAILDEEWQKRAKNLPYETPYQALIMASIIEKETGAASERADIAGVFVRRLQKNMRLQTDPTVIYGLGENFTGNLKRSHLKEPTPYNTYVIQGFPPTPIALVGREAIHAALHPAAGNTLFFVAKGDGTHAFSSTLAEHENAINEYQLKRTAGYRSSPVAIKKEAEELSSVSVQTDVEAVSELPATDKTIDKTEEVQP